MKGITEAVVEEIKLRTDLADLIASYGIEVKSAGSTKKACCPFHHEKTPSFNINERKGFYHCFGCGESGDAIKFVQKMDGCSFVEAVKKLAGPLGIKVEEREDPEAGRRKRLYALMSEVANFYHRCLLQTKEAAGAREYLEKRGLAGEVADDWLIGYAPVGCAVMLKWAEKHRYTPEELEAAGIIKAPAGAGDRGYHRFSGRLMFSVKDKQGRVVAFSGRQLVLDKRSGKYVNSPETLIFKKSNVLFGFDRAARAMVASDNPRHEGLICEGQIDTIRLHLAGFRNAVASQGTAFTEEHAKMLKKAADSMLLCYDDDGAGHKATIKVARMLLQLELPVRTVTIPGGEDPDSFITRYGAEKFRELTEKADSIVAFQVRSESAKEANPKSIDAVSRISRAVLQTIACSKSAVLKASMIDEAAKLMHLPVAALAEELAKTKVEKTVAAEPAETVMDDVETDGAEPSGAAPTPRTSAHLPSPPPLELDFLSFLLDHEYDAELSSAVGEYLPEAVFRHDFTRAFVKVWREECAAGEDRLAAFGDSLEGEARGWFDRLLLAQGKSLASSLSVSDILHEFVRNLWRAEIERRRGELPADESGDADRMRLTMDLKRLKSMRWALVKEFVATLYGKF